MDLFQPFPRLTRFSHGWQITEKLDGSNSQVIIIPVDQLVEGQAEQALYVDLGNKNNMAVFAASRNRLIHVGKGLDNHGFAAFAQDRATDFIETLGEGRHFGEWVGKGISKRDYKLTEKRFVLFNTARWTGVTLPARVDVVPVLAEGYMGEPGTEFEKVMHMLATDGSRYAPGFKDPEGIVMRHGPSGKLFKKTFDYDEKGKWAENKARQNGE